MGFMQPEVIGPTEWWMVDTTSGIQWVQCEFVGRENVKAVDLLDYLEDTFSAEDIIRWESQSGYGARLSAPGFLDCTPWSVFETVEAARSSLIEEHNLCPICLGELDEHETCPECVKGLSHEDFLDALKEYLEGVSALDIVHSVPGVFEIVSEAYNNEALDLAYQQMVIDYETKDQATKRSESARAPQEEAGPSS